MTNTKDLPPNQSATQKVTAHLFEETSSNVILPSAGSVAEPLVGSVESEKSAGQQAMVLAAACLALFMTNFDGTAGDMALPQIQKDFGASIAGVQWFLNAYHLPVASLLLVAGKFGDLFGRKRLFALGLTVFTVSSFLCGVAPTLPLLIMARACQGIGAAALIPLSLTLVTATFTEPGARAKAIGTWSAVSALALVVGPGLGGFLVDEVSWRSIFFINVPLGLATLSLTLKFLKKDKVVSEQPISEQSLDWVGLALSVSSIILLSYTLTFSNGDLWLSSQRITLLCLTMLSFGLFVIRQLATPYPVIPQSLMKNRRFAALCTTQTLVFFMSGGLFFILSLFLQHIQGYSAGMTGLCFLPMNGAIIAASFASGWVAIKLGWRFPILSGLVVMTVALVSLTGVDVSTDYGEILWKLLLAGLGGGLAIPALAAAAMNAVPPAQEGIASALSSISIQMGGILGIAIQGAIFSQRLTTDLARQIAEWRFPAALQREILADALHSLSEIPQNLPVPAEQFQNAIQSAFVLGLQTVLWVAAIAMIIGIALMLLIPHRVFSNQADSKPSN
ncbi:MAG: MFS transporter [Cyanobacteria bacterium P01_A01_bin.116]